MGAVDRPENTGFLPGAGSLNCGHNDPNRRSALTEYLVRDGIKHGRWPLFAS